MLSCPPLLTDAEYAAACSELVARFHRRGRAQDAWLAVDLRTHDGPGYLRVTQRLCSTLPAPAQRERTPETGGTHDADEEALPAAAAGPVVHYDIVLSPAYRVPVLYASVADPQHRYPPTFATLHEHVIPPPFRAQAAAAGPMGGVTVADHPATNRPAFFVHPCQTAHVMEAAMAGRAITAEDYLIAWIGALGKVVGLQVPLALVREDRESALIETHGSAGQCCT